MERSGDRDPRAPHDLGHAIHVQHHQRRGCGVPLLRRDRGPARQVEGLHPCCTSWPRSSPGTSCTGSCRPGGRARAGPPWRPGPDHSVRRCADSSIGGRAGPIPPASGRPPPCRARTTPRPCRAPPASPPGRTTSRRSSRRHACACSASRRFWIAAPPRGGHLSFRMRPLGVGVRVRAREPHPWHDEDGARRRGPRRSSRSGARSSPPPFRRRADPPATPPRSRRGVGVWRRATRVR